VIWVMYHVTSNAKEEQVGYLVAASQVDIRVSSWQIAQCTSVVQSYQH
jgi:hypothetical protein